MVKILISNIKTPFETSKGVFFLPLLSEKKLKILQKQNYIKLLLYANNSCVTKLQKEFFI